MLPHDRRATLVLILWLAFGVAASVRTFVKPASHTVFPVFAHAADRWWADEPVYADYRPLDHFRYPPVYAIAMTPFARLGLTLGGILWVWVSLAAYGWGCLRFLREVIPRRWSVGRESLFMALALFGGLRGLWNGQSNALIVGLLLLGCAECVAARWWHAAGWLTAAVLVKLTPLAVVLLLVALYPRQLGPRVALLMLVGLVLPFLTRAPSVVASQHLDWWEQMRSTTSERWPGFRDAWTLWQVVRQPFTGETEIPLREPLASFTYRAIQLLTAGLALLWVLLRCRTSSVREGVVLTLAMGSGWLLLFGPAVEHPTFVLLVPCLLWALLDDGGWLIRISAGCILILGWGAVVEPLRPWCPWLLASLPLGTLLFMLWLVGKPRGESAAILDSTPATEPTDARTERDESRHLRARARLGRTG